MEIGNQHSGIFYSKVSSFLTLPYTQSQVREKIKSRHTRAVRAVMFIALALDSGARDRPVHDVPGELERVQFPLNLDFFVPKMALMYVKVPH